MAGILLLKQKFSWIIRVSKDIRTRVLSHYSGDQRVYKGMRFSRQVRRIDFMETAG